MDNDDILQDALKDVISKGMFNDTEFCKKTYSGDSYMGNTVFEHMAIIDGLSPFKDFTRFEPEKLISDLKIEPSMEMKIALDLVKNVPTLHFDPDTTKDALGADDSQMEDGQRLRNIYLYYSEAWRNMRMVESELDKALEMKMNNSEAPEWEGMWHRCGFVGYTLGDEKICNECKARKTGNEFRGPHSSFVYDRKGDNARSITNSYRPRVYGKLIDNENFGEVLLQGVYNLQNRCYSELF